MANILPNFIRAAFSGHDRPIYHRWPVKPLYKAFVSDFLIECEREIEYVCDWIRRELDKPAEAQDWHGIQRHLMVMDGLLARRASIRRRIADLS